MRQKQKPDNKASIAAVLELGGGYFGLLGLGWIYVGDIKRGVLLLLGYLIFLIIGITLIVYALPCFVFVFALFYFSAPLLSAVKVFEFTSQRKMSQE